MQVSEGSDTFEFRSPRGMKAAHSRLRTFAGKSGADGTDPILVASGSEKKGERSPVSWSNCFAFSRQA